MPPGRRPRAANSAPPRQRRTSPAADVADDNHGGSAPSSSPAVGALPPFFNTTFSTHRVSPLHIGPEPLADARLPLLAQQLRDTLVGDVVRGVAVGLDGADGDGTLGRAGALELVSLHLVRLDALLGARPVGGEEGRRPASRDLRGDAAAAPAPGDKDGRQEAVHISLRYEYASFTGLLLPSAGRRAGSTRAEDAGGARESTLAANDHTTLFSAENGTSGKRFLHLPLLLLRMPAPLKPILIDFLSRAFDCRVAPLALGTRTLVGIWERWVADAGLLTRGPFAKDLVITLGFYAPAILKAGGASSQKGHEAGMTADNSRGTDDEETARLGVKAVDVLIPAEDLRRFLTVGQALEKEGGTSDAARTKRKAGAYATVEQETQKRRRLAGGKDEEGWMWRKPSNGADSAARGDAGEDGRAAAPGQPFTEALARYLDRHLALDMFHPAVKVVKIACGGFAVSEGKAKIFATAGADGAMETAHRKAVWGLYEGLIERARGRTSQAASV